MIALLTIKSYGYSTDNMREFVSHAILHLLLARRAQSPTRKHLMNNFREPTARYICISRIESNLFINNENFKCFSLRQMELGKSY